MKNEDYKRFESFSNSLDSLNEAKNRDLIDSFVLSGTDMKFRLTFDLAWKVMKDIIIQIYMIDDFVAGSPREVLRKSFSMKLIDDSDDWIAMLKLRNTLSHDYDGTVIMQACHTIIECYIDIFYKFKDKVEEILKYQS